MKPIQLKNFATGKILEDTLHHKAAEVTDCSTARCRGSFMNNVKPVGPVRSGEFILKEAKEFIDDYYQSIKRSGSPAHTARWEEIQQEVKRTDTYNLTETELIYGAKLAWRNAYRCIGRIQWNKLQVFDARYVGTGKGMFEAICRHLRYATNDGNLRSAMTVFPHRINGRCDFRVWNYTIIGYAGYYQEDGTIVGDPVNAELTQAVQRLGWVGKGTQFDVLPMVVQAADGEAQYFDLPDDLVLQVPLVHPEYPWFEQMGLRWYAVPGVSCLKLDCGGLEFSAIPFNGWYMVTEIGTRDLADPQRFNLAEKVAVKMGLDTATSATMWKDKAVIELNIAVLHSFQKSNVTIMDHHTSCETFMKHLDTEFKLRGGCPGDWLWLIPPTSGSLVSVYHQEILSYQLKPMYDYQDHPWKKYDWSRHGNIAEERKSKNYRFREIARAVRFSSKLFGKVYTRRTKATILYATETGKSMTYANQLAEIFNRAFAPQVICMADYDITKLEHEHIVLVVASTFGNGDPPENGESFAKALQAMKAEAAGTAEGVKASTLHSLLKTESGSAGAKPSDDTAKPLENVRFSVFALGSTAYPIYCAFGKGIDKLMKELGAECLNPVACGDELSGQEQSFKEWAVSTYKMACQTFCIQDSMENAPGLLRTVKKTENTVRFRILEEVETNGIEDSWCSDLSKLHSRTVLPLQVVLNQNLTPGAEGLETLKVALSWKNVAPELLKKPVAFVPGDHVGIMPTNRFEIVEGVLQRLTNCQHLLEWPVEVQLLEEIPTMAGPKRVWKAHPKLPRASIVQLLSNFLDITTPPTQQLLSEFAERAVDLLELQRLTSLSTNAAEYETWKHGKWPHLLEVLQEFPSVKMDAALLVSLLPIQQPRFYSISSSLKAHPDEVHLTVGVVSFKTQGGKGPMHYGVCSNFLLNAPQHSIVPGFFRSEPRFHLPSDDQKPIVMVGPGTGLAPFRAFWEDRAHTCLETGQKGGEALLLFGCRKRKMDLYREEKEKMAKVHVLNVAPPALSREPGEIKTYVQHRLAEPEMAARVVDIIVNQGGHFYVCGDCTMAHDVSMSLRGAFQSAGGMTEIEAKEYMDKLHNDGRYHEDIFGITLRAAEIHTKSHETAKAMTG